MCDSSPRCDIRLRNGTVVTDVKPPPPTAVSQQIAGLLLSADALCGLRWLAEDAAVRWNPHLRTLAYTLPARSVPLLSKPIADAVRTGSTFPVLLLTDDQETHLVGSFRVDTVPSDGGPLLLRQTDHHRELEPLDWLRECGVTHEPPHYLAFALPDGRYEPAAVLRRDRCDPALAEWLDEPRLRYGGCILLDAAPECPALFRRPSENRCRLPGLEELKEMRNRACLVAFPLLLIFGTPTRSAFNGGMQCLLFRPTDGATTRVHFHRTDAEGFRLMLGEIECKKIKTDA